MDYVMSEATARKVQDLIGDKGQTTGGVGGATRQRQVAYVQCETWDSATHSGTGVVVQRDETGWTEFGTADEMLLLSANDEDLETDKRYLALRYGETEDNKTIFMAVATVPPKAKYPLNRLPCLVKVEGEIVGQSQIWFDPETGEAECVTAGFCGCPPSDPPSPFTSCCSLWYCTTEGPVEVIPDESGLYTPPEDWIGTEPFLSEEAALAVCPPGEIEMECCESVESIDLSAAVSNKTGYVVELIPDSFTFTNIGPFQWESPAWSFGDCTGIPVEASIGLNCTGDSFALAPGAAVAGVEWEVVSFSCEPFEIVFDVVTETQGVCEGGGYRITITA